MVKSRFGYRTAVPSITSQKGQTKTISYKKGANSYKDNDDLDPTELAKAVDVRMIKVGRYKTRKGLDRATIPIGEASNASITSVVGAGVFTVSPTSAIAQKFIISTTGRLTRIDLNMRSTTASKGVLMVELYADLAGLPGNFITRTTLASFELNTTFAYRPAYFVQAPLLVATTAVWVVVRPQNSQVGSYEISTTTGATSALTSVTNGNAWSAATFAANVNLFTASNTPTKGVYKAYRPNLQVVTVFAVGDTLYQANSNGTTTVIKSGMNPAALNYRFEMAQDTLYWVNGLEKPYKWDFTTVTQVDACPVIPNNLMEHKGIMFFTNDADNTAVNYSNFALYDKFTSTDFVYMPGPKSADGIRAMAKLNGVAYFFAKRNKRILLGSDNDTFQDDDASSQRGTFSQESLVFDANYIYHADDEGVWQFNGSDEKNIAESFLEEYKAIPNKNSIQLDVYSNRIYIFYAPAGASENTECFVYNLTLGIYESKDKNTIIGHTFGRSSQDDSFIQASNRVGALYFAEKSTNDYANLGGQMIAGLYTAYSHYETPSQLKTAPKHRPQLPSVSGSYSVQVGYDKDFADTPRFTDVNVSGNGGRYNTGLRYNTGVRYAGQTMIQPKNLIISGEFNRLQRIYEHIAAHEPFEFDSETLTIETQRIN